MSIYLRQLTKRCIAVHDIGKRWSSRQKRVIQMTHEDRKPLLASNREPNARLFANSQNQYQNTRCKHFVFLHQKL